MESNGRRGSSWLAVMNRNRFDNPLACGCCRTKRREAALAAWWTSKATDGGRQRLDCDGIRTDGAAPRRHGEMIDSCGSRRKAITMQVTAKEQPFTLGASQPGDSCAPRVKCGPNANAR